MPLTQVLPRVSTVPVPNLLLVACSYPQHPELLLKVSFISFLPSFGDVSLHEHQHSLTVLVPWPQVCSHQHTQMDRCCPRAAASLGQGKGASPGGGGSKICLKEMRFLERFLPSPKTSHPHDERFLETVRVFKFLLILRSGYLAARGALAMQLRAPSGLPAR